MGSCCKHLSVKAFALQVRSWSGNQVPINLHQMNVILWQEKPGPQTQLLPCQSPVLRGGKSQLQAPSGPGPQMLPSCHRWGSQTPRIQSALRPPRHRGQVPQTASQADGCCHEVTEMGMQERFAAASRPRPGQWIAVVRTLEPSRTQPPACSWVPALALAQAWVG